MPPLIADSTSAHGCHLTLGALTLLVVTITAVRAFSPLDTATVPAVLGSLASLTSSSVLRLLAWLAAMYASPRLLWIGLQSRLPTAYGWLCTHVRLTCMYCALSKYSVCSVSRCSSR